MNAHWISLIHFLNLAWFLPVAVVFGIFSITRMIVEDTLFDRQRNWFFDRFPHEGYTTKTIPKRGKYNTVSNGYHLVTKGTYLGKLVSCPWCAGFWVSIASVAALLWFPVLTTLVLFLFSLRMAYGLLG